MKAEQQRAGKPAGRRDIDQLTHENSVTMRLEELASKYGFARFLVTTLPVSNHERVEDNVLISNWPSDLIVAYDDTRPLKTAPVFSALRDTSAPFQWSIDDDETRLTEDETQSATLFAAAGMKAGIAIPLGSPDGGRAVALFAGEHNVLSRRDLADLVLATMEAYDALHRLRSEPRAATAKLSDREVQVLNWAANGKTSVEIATILSLSDHTVNSYLNSAMRKLDCVNRTQLVAKALRLHLIVRLRGGFQLPTSR